MKHPDEEWISNKTNGHCGMWSCNGINTIAKIGSIYGKNKIQIFYYNMLLKIRYIHRKYKNKEEK